MIEPIQYLPTVRWTTIIHDVVLVTQETILLPATYRITIVPEDVNEEGALTAIKEIGFLIKDYVGHVFKITTINVGGDFTKVIVSDDFRTGYGPQTGRTAVVYKSVGMGRSPYIAPIEHDRLDRSALDYSRTLELDILYKRLYNETFIGDTIKWLPNIFDNTTEFGIAIGQDNTIIGNRSITIGQGLTTNSFFETILGTYSIDALSQTPTTWVNTDRLFTIGNGLDINNKSIALELFKSGYLKLYNGLLIGAYAHNAVNPINGTLQYAAGALQIADTNLWYKILTGLPETVDGTTTNVATVAGHTHLLGEHKHNKLYQPNNTNPFVYTDDLGSLHIDGNIIQNGSAYETHAEQVFTKDDQIILRDGAISGLSIGQYAGFTAKLYDGVNDGQLIFDKEGWARVGDVGNLQPLTTRIETPINGHYSYWEDSNKRLNFKQIPASDVVNTPYGAILATTVQNAINELEDKKQSLSTGFLSGLELSINIDNTKFNIAEGYYVITNYVNQLNPSALVKHFLGMTAITPAYLATANATYIALDASGNIIQSASPFTDENRRDYAIVGGIIHSNRININLINEIKAPITADVNQLHDFMGAIGAINTGNVYSESGVNLFLNKSGGKIFRLGINAGNYKDPHAITIPSQTALTFRYRLRNGSEYVDTQNIDPNNYDFNGVLTATPNNKFTIQHINLFQSGLTRIQYGQNQYDKIEDAVLHVTSEPFIVEQNIADNAVFRCFLIIKWGVTNLTQGVINGTVKFIPVDKFGNIVGSSGLALTYDAITTALGYIPENIASKENVTVDNSVIKYPTVNLLKTYADTKLSKIQYAEINRQGFLNWTETSVSFDGVNTFTLTDTGSGWSYYRLGTKYTFTGNKSIVLTGIPVTAGHYYIYIDDNSGSLIASTTAWSLLDAKISVATIRFNNNLTPKWWLSDERHTILLDQRQHYITHALIGTRILASPTLSGYTINSDLDASKTFGISSCSLIDQDIKNDLDLFPDPDGITTSYVISYRTGLSSWEWKLNSMPFSYSLTYIEYDNAGILTTGTNNKFYNSYLIATNTQGAARYVIVSGRGEFSSVTEAQSEDIKSFTWDGFDVDETVICYRLTWETSSSYTSKGQCRLAAIPKAVNISTTSNPSSGAGTDHNSLANLDLANSGITFGHISDQSQSIFGVKAFNSIPTTTVIPTTSYQLVNKDYADTKEPAFTKNTGFNKNFGSTAGTVLEGRTFGTAANSATTDFAPASGSANYIQNQNSSAQNANIWISSSGRFNNTDSKYGRYGIGFTDNFGYLEFKTNSSTSVLFGSDLNINGISNNIFDFYSYIGNFDFYPSGTKTLELSSSLTKSLVPIQATTAKLTNLSDGYLPYHISDASGLGNSPIYTDGTNVGIGFSSGVDRRLKIMGGANGTAIFSIVNNANSSEILYASTDISGNGLFEIRNSSNSSNVLLNGSSSGSSYILGSLGLGMTSSSAKLGIKSNGSLIDLNYANDAGSSLISWNKLDGTNLWSIGGGITSKQDELSFRHGSTNVLYLNDIHNVGIGYSTGTEITNNKLAVNGGGYFNTNLTVNGLASTNPRLLSASNTGQLTPITDGTNGQVLQTNGVGVYSFVTNNALNTSGMTANFIQKWDGTKFIDWVNPQPQTLASTASTIWNVNVGVDAFLTMTNAVSITMTNLKVGTSGTLTVFNQTTAYKLKIVGYALTISKNLTVDANGITMSGASKEDKLTWYFDGTSLTINGNTNYTKITF